MLLVLVDGGGGGGGGDGGWWWTVLAYAAVFDHAKGSFSFASASASSSSPSTVLTNDRDQRVQGPIHKRSGDFFHVDGSWLL